MGSLVEEGDWLDLLVEWFEGWIVMIISQGWWADVVLSFGFYQFALLIVLSIYPLDFGWWIPQEEDFYRNSCILCLVRQKYIYHQFHENMNIYVVGHYQTSNQGDLWISDDYLIRLVRGPVCSIKDSNNQEIVNSEVATNLRILFCLLLINLLNSFAFSFSLLWFWISSSFLFYSQIFWMS